MGSWSATFFRADGSTWSRDVPWPPEQYFREPVMERVLRPVFGPEPLSPRVDDGVTFREYYLREFRWPGGLGVKVFVERGADERDVLRRLDDAHRLIPAFGW